MTTRSLVLMVAIELHDTDDSTMVAHGVALAVKHTVGDREGMTSMVKIAHLPIPPLLAEFSRGNRVSDLGPPND